jgi:hypothetical protein
MTAASTESDAKRDKTLSRWLFNPFYYLAGVKAMAIGIVIILISGVLAFFGNSRFDGLLDFHTAPVRSPFWHCLSDGIISWLLLSTLLLVAGKIVSKSRVRVIDVFGTQALARAPYLFLALASVIPGVASRALRFGMSIAANQAVFDGFSMDILAFSFIIIITIAMTIWMIILMYRAFAVSCNVSGSRAISAFIVSLLIGELVSKIILFQLSGL